MARRSGRIPALPYPPPRRFQPITSIATPFCMYYGAEMRADLVRKWLASLGSQPLFIEPGSSWENSYCESFNGKLRDECLNGEIFYSLKEAQIIIKR